MSGLPLHPLVVHFPIVLTFLLPVGIGAALWAIRRRVAPRRAWAVPLAMAAALTLSAWIATETGEAEEDRVEPVVTEGAVHDHEESAERFLMLSGVLLLVTAAGLLPRAAGQAARLVAAGGALGLLAAGVQVGHSGGALVYRHGAAAAYVDAGTGATGDAAAPPRNAVSRREDDGDDR